MDKGPRILSKNVLVLRILHSLKKSWKWMAPPVWYSIILTEIHFHDSFGGVEPPRQRKLPNLLFPLPEKGPFRFRGFRDRSNE